MGIHPLHRGDSFSHPHLLKAIKGDVHLLAHVEGGRDGDDAGRGHVVPGGGAREAHRGAREPRVEVDGLALLLAADLAGEFSIVSSFLLFLMRT